jgi:hypothetical protein
MIIFITGLQGSKETGLDYLLGLDGNVEFQNDEGYWAIRFWKEVIAMKKVLKVGIATVEEQRARSLAIAAGTRQRGDDEPHI